MKKSQLVARNKYSTILAEISTMNKKKFLFVLFYALGIICLQAQDSYFNLNGFQDNIAKHKIQIAASKALETDADFAPIGKIHEVEGTAGDLRKATFLSKAFAKSDTGILQYYVFDDKKSDLKQVASVEDQLTGRRMSVWTTEPGMLLYTGFFTSDELQRENGLQYGSLRAFCCETSRCPNGVNDNKLPGTITKAGEKFESETVFKFSF